MSSIAIVGMACRFGGAPDLQSYWAMTVEGRNAFGPIPSDRWPAASFFDEGRRNMDKTFAPAGAFIDDIHSFPALELGIPPRRVEVMDPQQRLAIELGLQAIEDAGTRPSALPKKTGVFMGVTASEFRQLLGGRIAASMMAAGMLGEPPSNPEALSAAVRNVVPPRPFSAPGVLANMNAAAVAQELDLHGPAYTVDAACASAMIAIANAVSQLRTGDIDAALAGGVYLQVSPENYIAFSRIGAMSSSGICRPFDARADGFVQGDGGGTLLLKRLDDAVADGDRIYAVIGGVATNNDGRGDGPMAPIEQGQTDVVADAWASAGAHPSQARYLETHGTGTDVGDAIELNALRQAVGETSSVRFLGSSKANVGHTMSAAGVAGVIRSAMAIHTGVIPPMANFGSAKSDLGLDTDPRFEVPTTATDWEDTERWAGVSSFGFGGTNGHAVLRNAPAVSQASDATFQTVALSAPDDATLRGIAARLADDVERGEQTVAGVARAWAVRPSLAQRATVTAATRAQLIEGLRELAEGRCPKGGAVGTVTGAAPKVALLFPGQGSQRVGMLADIRRRFPIVEQTLSAFDAELADELEAPLAALIDSDAAPDQLTATQNCQPALVAAGLSLWALLDKAGVRPSVATGHSLGEFAAAAVAGVLSPTDAVRFSARRGRAMANVDGDPGAMLALTCDAQTAEQMLVDGAVVANDNHPTQVVVSGTTSAVETVEGNAQTAGIEGVRLDVSHAFHSPLFAALKGAEWMRDITVADPNGIAVASCIQDSPYRNADDARDVFDRHARCPVRFRDALRQCDDAGAEVYLQVGAGGPLASFARKASMANAKGIFTLASMDDNDGGRSLLETLGWLWCHGVAVDFLSVTSDVPVASVPPIVLPRERYWPIKEKVQRALVLDGMAAVPAAKETAPSADDPSADAPTADANTGDDVYDAIARIVAKVSSYPLAALRPELSLVDDLGFDSIMVGDLTTGLAEAFPALGGLPQELLLNRPTVQVITDYVRATEGGQGATFDDGAPLHITTPTWRPRALPASAQTQPLNGQTVAIVAGAHQAIADHLVAAGATLTDVLDANVDHLVWLALDDGPAVADVVNGTAPLSNAAHDLLVALKTLGEAGANPHVTLIRRTDNPWAEGLSGIVRSIAREWPGTTAKSLHVDDATDLSDDVLVQEFASNDRSTDVRLAKGQRWVAGQDRFDGPSLWTPGPADTVLVTGGTRGIGAKFAARLAESGAQVLALGRSAPDAPAWGSNDRVSLVQADICDRDALRRALADHPNVTAIIHCAGMLADGAIESLDLEQARAAFEVKVGGLLSALHAAGPTVHTALSIGSWAGRFGNRHQAAYAAANATLSALHAGMSCRVVCAEFGPWSESTMVQTIPAAVQASMRAAGIDFVNDEAGLDALWAAATHAEAGIAIMGRDLPWCNQRIAGAFTLSVATHPYLADHAIDGTPVFPLASALDAMAEAANIPLPFEVTDLVLFRGITASEPVDIGIQVEGDRVELTVGPERALAYRARVRPTDSADVDVPDAAPVRPLETSLDAFYAGITFHGPLLQGITAVNGQADDRIVGTLSTGQPVAWEPGSTRSAWAVDPLVLDSAFQLAGLSAWERFGRAGTPVGVRRLRLLRETPADSLSATVLMGDAQGDRFTARIVISDDDGPVIVVDDVVAELKKAEGDEDLPEIDPAWVDPAQWAEVKDLDMRLEAATALGIRNPYFHVHEGTARDTTVVDGRQLINFSSYNYLGLSGDPRVLKATQDAVERFGTSVSASRVASGERPFHNELEAALAEAQGVEATLVFTAGHMTNVNLVGHVMQPADLVLHDELIHDSILQGIKLSGAGRRAFKHDDPDDLERLLRELRGSHQKCMIAVEGVYSMDGDICKLPAYVALKKRYGAILLVDEAHSFGIIGDNGRGVGEHFSDAVDPREVDLWMGTLSKSLASCGGWIGGSETMIRYLRYTAPGFVYSAGITPANGTAALASLRLMNEEPWRVKKLQDNALHFHDELVRLGVDTGPAKGGSGVVPAVTGNSMHALLLSQRLADQGINVQPIVYPAVADDAARLRFFLSSTHTTEQLSHTAQAVATTLAELREEFPAV